MITEVKNMPEVDVQAALQAGLAVWEKMGEEGDIKTTWDPNSALDIEEKRREFERLTKERKMLAFRVRDDGSQGERMHTFEPQAGRMIFVPPMQGG